MDKDLTQLEELYNRYIKNINDFLPDGVIDVSLSILQRFGLLTYHSRHKEDQSLTRYFHVIESPEKITLINDQFIVWIVPDKVGEMPITYILVALNTKEPHLEVAFSTTGIYNSSRLVLRVLEKFLHEIQENEDTIKSLKNAKT